MTDINPLQDFYFAGKFKKLSPRYKKTVLWLIDRGRSGEARFTLMVMKKELGLPSTGACVASLRFLQDYKMIKRQIHDENNLNVVTFVLPYLSRN